MKLFFHKQQGYLMMLAVLMIVVIGFLGIAVSYMFTSSTFASINQLQSSQALNIAEAGLERAKRALLTPNLSDRISCVNLTGNSNVTNATYSGAAGTFTVSGDIPYAPTSIATLSGTLSSSDTTITTTSTIPTGSSGYAPSGRIVIDQEYLNYAAISGNTFLGVTRGVDGTIASSHNSNTRIGQYQCAITASGGIPQLSTPSAKRTLSDNVQLPEGWMVGESGNILRWNKTTELQMNSQSSSTTKNLNAVSMLSNSDGWAVGDNIALRYNGSSWSSAGISSSYIYRGVSAISSNEAWVVGEKRIFKWNGSSWSQVLAASNDLYGISMLNSSGSATANAGWAVGNAELAYYYDGSSWSPLNDGLSNVDLRAVSTVSATNAWAVGKRGKIYHYNGSSWSTATSPTNADLNAISMLNATTGWIVGRSQVALFYNGSGWSSSNSGISAGTNLNAVITISANEAWAAGDNGRVFEWNGSTWTSVSSGITRKLFGISFIAPHSQPQSAWSENFG